MLLQTLYFSVNYKDTEFLLDMSSVLGFFFAYLVMCNIYRKQNKTSHIFFPSFCMLYSRNDYVNHHLQLHSK